MFNYKPSIRSSTERERERDSEREKKLKMEISINWFFLFASSKLRNQPSLIVSICHETSWVCVYL